MLVGPPRATVLDVDTHRVSDQPENDRAVAHFVFNLLVVAWTARVNSNSHLDGTLVAHWETSGTRGFGLQPFGRAPFGHKGPDLRMHDEVTVTSEHLLHGDNEIAIYGKGEDGRWSFPPAHNPVEQAVGAP